MALNADLAVFGLKRQAESVGFSRHSGNHHNVRPHPGAVSITADLLAIRVISDAIICQVKRSAFPGREGLEIPRPRGTILGGTPVELNASSPHSRENPNF